MTRASAKPAAPSCEWSGLNWSHIEHDYKRIRALEAQLAVCKERDVWKRATSKVKEEL